MADSVLGNTTARVADFAQTRLLTCAPEMPVSQVAALMRERACSSILVVEHGQPIGIWTERDAARTDFTNAAAFDVPISHVMSGPLASIAASSEVSAAVLFMQQHNIRHLVVLDDDKAPIGIVTQTDLALRYGVEHFLRLRTVGEILTRTPLRLSGNLPAAEAGVRMNQAGCDAAIVEGSDGRLGIFTERDLLGLVASRQTAASLDEMASFPLRTAFASEPLLEVRNTLIEARLRHLGITAEDGSLIGLLSLHHILDILDRTYADDLARALRMRDEELMRSQQDLTLAHQVIDSSDSAVMVVTFDGTIISVNPAFTRITGHAAEAAIGLTADGVLNCNQMQPNFCAALCASVEHHGYWRGNLWCRHQDGSERAYAFNIHAILHAGAPTHRYAAVFFDNTERLRSEERLLLAASVFSHACEGIMITNVAGSIVEVNEAFMRITGYSRHEVIGKNPGMFKSGRQGPDFYACMWRALHEKGYWAGEVWNRRKGGEFFAASLTISAVRDAAGGTRHYVALFTDITAQKEHQQQLEHIAHYDALTGLPNRVLLADRMRQALAQSRRRDQQLAVAFIDLDGFKAINDSHGHEAGDQLLIVLADRMRQTLRDGDTIARLGGDEFVAVLVDLPDLQASVPFIVRLLAAAAQPVEINGLVLRVSASIGVSFQVPMEDGDADQLMRQADQAMYQAKLAGKNRYHVFDAEQDRNVRGHHESIERIRCALDEQEFVLYYQPKVNLRTGVLIGAEALIRWQHPTRGLLAPSLFLHEIEDHPLGVCLGEWVIDTALTQIERWLAQGLEIPVSVNIAANHLQQSDFVERLRIVLAKHPDVDPAYLELEVLETSALEDMSHVSALIAACAQMGISFALDDFGTGYSSLTYLKRLPAHVLKIDQSFVHDMLDDPDDLAILEGVLGLATAFGREAIAEGVETVAHGEILLRLGCELAQGYGIARPMPAENIVNWQKTWQPDPIWSQTQRLSRDLLPILFAGVEHRSWIRALGEHIEGKRVAPPALDHHQCRFGLWLDKARPHRVQRHAEVYNTITTLHQQVHTMAMDLLRMRELGYLLEAQAGMSQLHELRDNLLIQLRTLMEEV